MFINKAVSNIINFEQTNISLTGLAATLIGIISFIPVLYVVYKTKKY